MSKAATLSGGSISILDDAHESTAIGAVEEVARRHLGDIVIDGLLALLLVFLLDVLEDRVQANGLLTWEHLREQVFQHAILLAVQVVQSAVRHGADLGPLLDLLVLLREVNHVCAGPDVHVVEDEGWFRVARVKVQGVQHSHAVHGHDAAETVANYGDCSIFCQLTLVQEKG